MLIPNPPASWFLHATRLNLKGLATGLVFGGAVALAVHLGSLCRAPRRTSGSGEALPLALQRCLVDRVAVMATLMSLALVVRGANVVAACRLRLRLPCWWQHVTWRLAGQRGRDRARLVVVEPAGRGGTLPWLRRPHSSASRPCCCVEPGLRSRTLSGGTRFGRSDRHGPASRPPTSNGTWWLTGRPVEIDFARAGPRVRACALR